LLTSRIGAEDSGRFLDIMNVLSENSRASRNICFGIDDTLIAFSVRSTAARPAHVMEEHATWKRGKSQS